MDDFELLEAYVNRQAEDSFAALVDRHIHLVYSAALRQMREPQAAQEVAQAVFIILARKAASIRPGTILAGWLLRTTRYTAANARRSEQRRQHFEREAMNRLQSTESDAAWERIAPLLDDALCRLSENDRAAIALRFFEQKSFKEVGAAVSLSENSARMRVTRALERLRRFLAQRGVTLSALTLGSAIAANAVQAAPPGLAGSVSVAAVAEGAEASVSVAALVAGALKLLAWAKIKTAALIGVPAALWLVGTAVVVVPWSPQPSQIRNGDFEENLKHWWGYADPKSPARAKFTTEKVPGTKALAAKISVINPAYHDSVEWQYSPVSLQAGHRYAVTFRARSTVAQPLRVKIIGTPPPWRFYGFRVITEVTPRWQKFRLTGRSQVTANDGKLMFQCGGIVGDIWIDDVEFRESGK